MYGQYGYRQTAFQENQEPLSEPQWTDSSPVPEAATAEAEEEAPKEMKRKKMAECDQHLDLIMIIFKSLSQYTFRFSCNMHSFQGIFLVQRFNPKQNNLE